MEKIKKAIEKARLDREKESGQSSANSSSDGCRWTSSDYQYTKTRSLAGSIQQMREHRLINAMEPSGYTDSIKILSTQVLQRMNDNDWRVIAVTSPRSNAGKTTVAINLGLSIAREVEYTVMLVDANLRKPGVHQYFDIKPATGLNDYLTSTIDLSDVLINPKGVSHFVVLPAGEPSDSSAELLGSPNMYELIGDLKSRYEKRIIILDLPSVLDTADALNALPAVDAALLVIEEDETNVNDLRSSIDMLSVTNIIGTVLNKS